MRKHRVNTSPLLCCTYHSKCCCDCQSSMPAILYMGASNLDFIRHQQLAYIMFSHTLWPLAVMSPCCSWTLSWRLCGSRCGSDREGDLMCVMRACEHLISMDPASWRCQVAHTEYGPPWHECCCQHSLAYTTYALSLYLSLSLTAH